ncbi:succinate-semialdehyde dehydrogenase [Malassezia pachydermatis]|uniref:succinate-semialdehyde dehydrogenase [NAD(P)(+)] n=1 Tax=Malassezia pachydermatis TaxID=77020 RepID=A0A0M9VR11_9BASI|nr:succinate-semialdehyde dehydrogenase [Malassezia pachydermatis]KOS16109.1 succinate-semialdehyde dehydrogenase [Malassezia pachydermatis]
MPNGVANGGQGHLQLSNSALLQTKSYINGEWVNAQSGSVLPVYNKATGDLLAEVVDQSRADTEVAIDAASEAFKSWSQTTPHYRHDMLLALHAKLRDNADDLARIIVAENGKCLTDAKGEVNYANSFIQWFAEQTLRIQGYTTPSPVPGVRTVVMRQPVGVAGLIAPWNFPLAMITRKVAPALGAGCTAVVKAPHEAPLSALAMAHLAEEIGLPRGVLNVLVSSKGKNENDMGLALCESEKVDKISFTGSTRVGKILVSQSAGTLKKLSMELGGNAPFIVFDDADLDQAVANAVACKFRCAGQTCISANRLYVHAKVYDEFAEKFAAKVRELRVGNGMDQGVNIGPLVNEAGHDKAEHHVKQMLEAGSKLLIGGHKGEGLFFEPTVVLAKEGVRMPTDEEETFGPVAVLYKFNTEEEVLRMANDVRVGLAGYFFSQDVQRCFRVAEALHVGMIGVNTGIISSSTMPFGGVLESGFGREGGPTGMDEYLFEKAVSFGGM